MNTKSCPRYYLFLGVMTSLLAFAANIHSQSAYTIQGATPVMPVPVQIGPHSRTWTNSTGSHIIEMTTGMNYWNGQQWTPSIPSFEISPDGSNAVADQVQHKVTLAANLNTQNAVSVVTPDGVTLNSTPYGIGLYDAASGNFSLIGTLTNCTGYLTESNVVVYSNAFNSVCANVVYTLGKGSFHQDVVITGHLDPADYGFPSNTTRIQVITEFFDPPQPDVLKRPLYIEQNQAVRSQMVSPDLIDQTLGFGKYVYSPGRAYTAASTNRNSGGPIAKELVTVGQRHFLIETVGCGSLQKELDLLPECQQPTNAQGAFLKAGKARAVYAALPSIPKASATAGMVRRSTPTTVKVAAGKPQGSVVIDYEATLTSMDDDFTLQSDTTYLVSGAVIFNGNVAFEGGTVIKYDLDFSYYSTSDVYTVAIQLNNSFSLGGASYRPIIFTGTDDDSVGTCMSAFDTNYTGSTSGKHYGSTYLQINSYGFSDVVLSNLRMSYAQQAVLMNNYQNLTINDSQFVNCVQGFGYENNSGQIIALNNCLLSSVQYPFFGGEGLYYYLYNCTVDHYTALETTYEPSYDNYYITNSIFANNTSSWSGYTIYSGYNYFYNATPFGGSVDGGFGAPFQICGAGNYYIPPASGLHGAGTANIPSTLLADLAQRTTFAPVVFSNTVTTPTTLSPEVPRDTNAFPDMGYHYPAVDYLSTYCLVSNAALLLTNGVVLAYDNYQGLMLNDFAELVSQGTPTQPNVIVYYHLIQEQFTNLNSGFTYPSAIYNSVPINAYGNSNSVSLRFTTISEPIGGYYNTIQQGSDSLTNLTLRDCEFYTCGEYFEIDQYSSSNVLYLENNLFHRPYCLFINASSPVTAYNNLCIGSGSGAYFYYNSSGSSSNVSKNNTFDNCDVYLDGSYSNNAYLNGSTLGMAAEASSITTNLTWVSGPLGNYYQATNSPLIHKGSTTADQLGLYHYTVLTNQVPESNSIVDIGYHYMALGTNGLPLSTSGDGIGDYLKDSNGDGIYDIGDLGNWLTNKTCVGGVNDYIRYLQGQNLNICTTYTDTNGILGLQVYTPLK